MYRNDRSRWAEIRNQDARVEVDRAAGKVTVESTESAESIRELIQELGYAAQVSA
ncbi:heavy metal transporter [Pseudomonas aeruginosa]|nr:heavy metal transporter [Pseudomonas aeruginosa]